MEKEYKQLNEAFKQLKELFEYLDFQVKTFEANFKQSLLEYENQNNYKFVLEQISFYDFNKNEIEDTKTLVKNALENVSAENYVDVYSKLNSINENITDDLNVLLDSTMDSENSKEILEFQYVQVDTFKKQLSIVLENIDALIYNAEQLSKQN